MARESLMLCAPFVKAAVIDRLLAATSPSVSVEVFTRWRPDEVAAGVSDTDVLRIVEARGGHVFLCDRLHAKAVKFDNRALIGSANLTATALGWTLLPNLELLLEVTADSPELVALEQALRQESILATPALADEIDRIAALLPTIEFPPTVLAEEEQHPVDDSVWLPALRQPTDLYVAYSSGVDRLSTSSARAAARDLAALELPPGLDPEQFRALVGSRLLQAPLVRDIDAFVAEPRRFGAVRDLLAKALGVSREEADFAWQTMMRWLLEFLPERYARQESNWSEIFVRLDVQASAGR